MNNVIVYGSNGHAKVVIDAIEKMGSYNIVGLIDSYKPPGSRVYGYEVLGDDGYLQENKEIGGIVAIGDNWSRGLVVSRILTINPSFKFITVIHPDASIAKGVEIGEGSVIMAASIINSDTAVGKHCILNTRSSLDHDSTTGDFCTLAPNATTGGSVKIGDYSALCLSASVIHGKRIGRHTVIGAGSTVLTDIDDYVVAYGTPAKAIKKRVEGEKYL